MKYRIIYVTLQSKLGKSPQRKEYVIEGVREEDVALAEIRSVED